MKISCLKEDLAHGLSVVNHAVPNRAPLAITQNVLLSAKDSKLKLSATNLEIFITTWAGAVIEEEGEITVPALRFHSSTQADWRGTGVRVAGTST